jgi:hypothetical protein
MKNKPMPKDAKCSMRWLKRVVKSKNFTMSKSLTPKFMSKFAGPFLIVEQMFKDV